ncbi:MAG: ACT domain-containing protein [Eubacterium sp.]|nr:ACT domain-containing protein [Eubacterium sp.]
MRAIITVVGKDMVGILAKVSGICAENNVNIIEVTQSIMQELFCMIMMADTSGSSVPFTELAEQLEQLGKDNGLVIHAMREDLFNSMHRI